MRNYCLIGLAYSQEWEAGLMRSFTIQLLTLFSSPQSLAHLLTCETSRKVWAQKRISQNGALWCAKEATWRSRWSSACSCFSTLCLSQSTGWSCSLKLSYLPEVKTYQRKELPLALSLVFINLTHIEEERFKSVNIPGQTFVTNHLSSVLVLFSISERIIYHPLSVLWAQETLSQVTGYFPSPLISP